MLLASCSDGDGDYVAVVGVGEARQFPDFATVPISIERRAETAAQATAQINLEVARLLETAREFDVTQDDFQDVYLRVEPFTETVTQPDGTRSSEPAGYRAEQYLELRVDDIDQAGAILGALVAAAENIGIVRTPTYHFEDEAALFETARALAIEDARRRATEYAESAGRPLGAVLIIEESGTDSQRLNFQLKDRLTSYYRQEESGGGPIERIGNASRENALFTTPREVSVSISIYAKFALE